MRRSRTGTSLSQYAVVVGILAVCFALAFSLQGQILVSYFSKLLKSQENMNEQIRLNINSDAAANNNNNASPDNPVQDCSGTTCNIDFGGSFVLNGIPADFGELVETSGSSAGTDAMVDIMNQIADQIDSAGDHTAAEEYRKLANLSHFIADMQKKAELFADQCRGDADIYTCYKNKFNQPNGVPLPPELTSVMPDYNPNSSLSSFLAWSNLGTSMRQKNYQDAYFTQHDTEYPGFAMVNLYDDIMNNPAYGDEIKGVTQEIFYQMGVVNYNQAGKLVSIQREQPMSLIFYDPLTSDSNGVTQFQLEDGMNDITNPKTSANTDISAALMCAAGWNQDTGSQCH